MRIRRQLRPTPAAPFRKRLVACAALLVLSAAAANAAAAAQTQPGDHSHIPERPARTLAPLAAGLTVPIEINHTYRAGKTAPGTTIVASTTQRIPLGNHRYLRYGVKVVGTVVASTRADKATGKPATMTIRFDKLVDNAQTIPLRFAAVAVANFTDVADTSLPANANIGRGTAEIASMTTHQIGGEEICRSGWDGPLVDAHLRPVGYADHYGVYADPPPHATGTAAIPHALGAFSSTAKGLYGFDGDAELLSANGAFTITSPHGLVLRSGDDFLLQVLPNP